MNTQTLRKSIVLGLALNLGCLLAARAQNGNTNIWFGPGAGLNNWSTALNWTNATTGTQSGLVGGDDVKMFSTGGTMVSNVDNVVDVNTSIGSLVYGSTNNTTLHTTLIADGVTLSVTNTGGLSVGTPIDFAVGMVLTNTITGPNGTLVINNAAANIGVNQANNSGNPSRATLDLSGLGTFQVTASRIAIGDTTFPGLPVAQHTGGNLILAKTNVISLSYSDTLANYQKAGKNYAIVMSRNAGNNPGIISVLQLGITNAFFLDSMDIGMDKSGNNSNPAHGVIMFNPAFGANAPSAYFRGVTGATDPTSRITWWGVGDGNSSASSSNGGGGTNDFSLGSIDALINVLSLARDAGSSSDTWVGPHKGVFTFASGTVDANTVIVGNQSLETGTSTAPSWGQMNVNGANAVLKVNSTLTLGNNTLTTAAGVNTRGQLNINAGKVYANNIVVGANSISNSVAINAGTLVVSNSLATNAAGLFTFSITNSTLGLTVTPDAGTKVVTKTLNTFGAANTIQLDPATVIFPSYPQQFALIKYTTWVGANNFALASVPAWAPGATIVSNSVNSSLDLMVPNDPRPVFTSQPSPDAGLPGYDVSDNFAVTIAAGSVQPLAYQWYYVTSGNVTNTLTDGSGPSGASTLTGSTTAHLVINNAQIADSGNYFVVVANAFGTNQSTAASLTISATPIPPSVGGPSAVTTTNGSLTVIKDTVAGAPVPTLRWQFNGVDLSDGPGPSGSSTISGTTTKTLTISNPQYPGDQGTYSLIGQNTAGKATNDTVVTVLVPPSIGTQPTNFVVVSGQPASFTVVASGVPTPTYQWYKNSLANPISSVANPSAVTATLTIASAAPSDTATYFVVVQNPAGSITSSSVTLTVNSTMSPTALKPANGSSGISYDTPLYITFNTAPTIRAAGKIQIFNVTNSATPVDTIDMSLGTLQNRTIATETFATYPIIVAGNTAAIYPHLGVLTSNQTYYATIDDGVFADSTGAYFAGITDTNAWQFTTKVTGPANPTNMVVAQDYSGDFATVQGAIDSLPANNTSLATINVRDGVYTEVVEFKKNNILVRGQTRGGTIIGYANNSSLNASTHSRMAMKVNANDIALDNLTVTNSTAQDFSQAEAIMIESGAARCIVNNCNVDSYQDTILANISTSKAYFNRSLIQGDVDFIWGGGNLFFTNCEVRYLIRAGNSAALGPNPSPGATDINSNGFSFVNCSLTTLPGANKADTVGRTRGITNGNTALINCFVSTNIGGWSSDALPTSSFRNWYYGCTNDLGASVTLSNGIPLSASDTNVANASSVTYWLYGWQPQLSPNIVTNPASQIITAGGTAKFSVAATGIPDPTYQWQVNGTNIDGATNATLTIPSATSDNDGPYTVIVTTSSGRVTSASATLAVNPNVAPVFTAPVNGTIFTTNVGANIAIISSVTDDPAQTLTYLLLAGPTNAALNAANGLFTWRPLTVQADSTNTVTVAVTDNGLPDNLSATNSFTIVVNPLTLPVVSQGATGFTNNQFSLSVNGQVGPTYVIQVSTDILSGWTTLYTTNPTTMPFNFTDPNASSPQQFYRILVGP
jgi:pectin methylesterase-like acyl-CoA thioesterase